jgi:hypothetical protein
MYLYGHAFVRQIPTIMYPARRASLRSVLFLVNHGNWTPVYGILELGDALTVLYFCTDLVAAVRWDPSR